MLLTVNSLAMMLALAAAPAVPESPPNTAAESAAVPDATTRAVNAAERAALAAERAAEAASRAAGSAEQAAIRAADAAARSVPAAALPAPAAPEAPAAAAAAAEPKPVDWTGTATIGLISLTGNSSSVTVSGAGQAERRSENWITALSVTGAYGEARGTVEGAEKQTIALAAGVQLRGDRRFTERYAGYLLTGVDTDHVKSIEARPFGEAGLNIIWIDTFEGELSKVRLSNDIAFRYGKELRFQYYPVRTNIDDVSVVAPKFGLKFRYALNNDVVFTEDAEVLPTVVGDSRVLATSTTKLSARILEPLSVGIAFQVKHDSQPAEGKVPTDTSLTFGLEAGF